jgi:membrane protein implicated in regulation of membrane protease activity
MRQELEGHLAQALADGRSIESVIGDDPAAFAQEWAAAQQPRQGTLPSWDEVLRPRRKRFGWVDISIGFGIVALVIAALIWGRGGESEMDNEIWRWVWLGAAGVFGIGEMFTAGFFMLPFAFGAVAALPLAWFNVNEMVQLAVFLVVSMVSLYMIQRMMKKADEHQPAVGANRFLHRRALVIEPIDRVAGTGRVRVDTELWRATTDGVDIPEGTEVEIVEVRGTRLVVEEK